MTRVQGMLAVGFAVIVAGTGPIHSQQVERSASARERFLRFAERFVGTWNCTIRELRPDGSVAWNDTQLRSFEVSFRGMALEERANHESRPGRGDNFGLHVLLLQDTSGAVTQYGIWPGGAARMFTVRGALRADGAGIDGRMITTDSAGREDTVRVEIAWIDRDRPVYRVFARASGRSEYLREELVYSRASPRVLRSRVSRDGGANEFH